MSVPGEETGGTLLGARLRQAREARELSPQALAQLLKVSPAVIQALERDDHSALPAPTYVRGYLRSLARHLGLDPEAVLAQYRPPVQPEPELRRPPSLSRPLILPRIPWDLIGAALALALGGSALVWLVPRVSEKLATLGVDEQGQLQPLTLEGREEGGERPGLLPPAVPAPGSEGDAESPVTAAPEIAGESPREGPRQPPVVASLPPAASPPAAAPVQAVEPPPGSATEPPALKRVAPPPALELEFSEDSWVDIQGSHGRLLYGLVRAGSHRVLDDPGPYRLVLGNAAGVHLHRAGEPVDLSAYNRGQVARLRLE